MLQAMMTAQQLSHALKISKRQAKNIAHAAGLPWRYREVSNGENEMFFTTHGLLDWLSDHRPATFRRLRRPKLHVRPLEERVALRRDSSPKARLRMELRGAVRKLSRVEQPETTFRDQARERKDEMRNLNRALLVMTVPFGGFIGALAWWVVQTPIG